MAIVKKAGIRSAIYEARGRAKKERARFMSQRRFIEDHVPGVVALLDECERDYRVHQSRSDPERFKVVAQRCKQVPWCIPCVQHFEWRRAQSALRAFARCTPEGKEPRFMHIVQAARLTEDGEGWGAAACQDVQKFKRVVWDTTQDMLGTDIGGVLTYQDFGERSFLKRNPHVDFTVNGWTLTEDGWSETPRFDLKDGGAARWHAAKGRYVERYLPGAWSAQDAKSPGKSLDIKRSVAGASRYYKALHYQVREMVDVRKLEYDRERQVVYWHNYKDATRAKMDVLEFKASLAEYEWRLKQWTQGEEKGMDLTTRHGHLSDRRIKATQEAMGGVDPWEGQEEWERGWLPGD